MRIDPEAREAFVELSAALEKFGETFVDSGTTEFAYKTGAIIPALKTFFYVGGPNAVLVVAEVLKLHIDDIMAELSKFEEVDGRGD